MGNTGASIDSNGLPHGIDPATDWFVNAARAWLLLWEMGSAPFQFFIPGIALLPNMLIPFCCRIIDFFGGYGLCFDGLVTQTILPPMANSWMAVRNKDITAFGVKIPNGIDYSELKNNDPYIPPKALK